MWSLRSTAQERITVHGAACALGSFFLFVVFMVFVIVFPVVLLPVFLFFFNAKRSKLR